MTDRIRIGSRKSALAVAQSELIIEQLRQIRPETELELVTMQTTGDRILDRPLDLVGGKGLFVKELDRALLLGACDLTVHSAKDMPMELSEELPVVAYSKREDCRDVLVLRTDLESLPQGAVIGTSSKRRMLQAEKLFPGARMKGIRGNVLTRLEKLDAGEYDALILAAAGLIRLGLQKRISRYFSVEEMVPAAGQGILAVQSRKEMEQEVWLKELNCEESELCIEAERSFVKTLDGGCSAPTAALAQWKDGTLTLTGLCLDATTGVWMTGCMTGFCGKNPEEARRQGVCLADRLRNKLKQQTESEAENG